MWMIIKAIVCILNFNWEKLRKQQLRRLRRGGRIMCIKLNRGPNVVRM